MPELLPAAGSPPAPPTAELPRAFTAHDDGDAQGNLCPP